MEGNKSSTGLDQNIAGLLTYVFGWITGLIFFFIEKQSSFVKFHAMQSILTFGAITILNILLGNVILLGFLIRILSAIVWVFLIYKAYNNEMFKVPYLGDIAEKQSGI